MIHHAVLEGTREIVRVTEVEILLEVQTKEEVAIFDLIESLVRSGGGGLHGWNVDLSRIFYAVDEMPGDLSNLQGT